MKSKKGMTGDINWQLIALIAVLASALAIILFLTPIGQYMADAPGKIIDSLRGLA